MPQPAGRRSNWRAGKGLVMSKSRKRSERDERMAPVDGTAQQSDPLAGHFVDDHEARVVPAALASGDRGGGNADCDGNDNAAKKNQKQSCGRRMETPGDSQPTEVLRPPIPTCRDPVCPGRRRRKWRPSRPRASCGRRVARERLVGGSDRGPIHPPDPLFRPPVSSPRSSSTSGSSTGELILYTPMAHLPRSILRQRSEQNGKVFVLGLNNHAAGGAMEKLGGFFLCGSHLPMSYYLALGQAGAPRPQCRWPRSWERRRTGRSVVSRSRSTGTFSAWPSGQFGCGSMSSMM